MAQQPENGVKVEPDPDAAAFFSLPGDTIEGKIESAIKQKK